MKEIGGYFEWEDPGGQAYHEGLVALNTSRNALKYLILARGIQKLYLPYYMCNCVADLCQRSGCDFEYYSIKEDFTPDFSRELGDDEYLYMVNYFGQLPEATIHAWKQRYPKLILDNAHAFFQQPQDGIDTIYSCRKFFGVPDGAYLSTDCHLETPLEPDRSGGRLVHLIGRLEDGARAHHKDFVQNEEDFTGQPLRSMSQLTRRMLRSIDYETARRRREENFSVLHNRLQHTNGLRPYSCPGPFCYPYYLIAGDDRPSGGAVRKRLASQGIYVPTLWPEALEYQGQLEADYAENILPLPCDQRYGPADMNYLADRLEEALDER